MRTLDCYHGPTNRTICNVGMLFVDNKIHTSPIADYKKKREEKKNLRVVDMLYQ